MKVFEGKGRDKGGNVVMIVFAADEIGAAAILEEFDRNVQWSVRELSQQVQVHRVAYYDEARTW